MTIINSRLGSGFLFKTADSSKNQEHYFGGTKKHIRMRWNCFSGTAGPSSEFALTGAEGIEFSKSLYDANDVAIIRGDQRSGDFGYEPNYFPSVFGASASGTGRFLPINSVFGCLISASNTAFSKGDIDILEQHTEDAGYYSIAEKGIFRDSDEKGYKEFIYITTVAESIPDTFISQVPAYIFSCSSGKTYTFKDARNEFDVALTNCGVEFFKNIDNQHTEKISSYVNRDIMKNVED